MKNIDQDKANHFVSSVLDRYQTLIQLGIYPVTMTKIEAWISNFSEPHHRYMAALMLDRLIYRSHKMAKESYQSFLVAVLRDLYFDFISESPEPIPEWLYQLRIKYSRYSNRLAIAPVRCPEDSGASGDTICRMVDIHTSFTRHLTVNGFEGKSELPSDMVIMLVDDMLGSGEQINTFAQKVNLHAWSERNSLICVPLISTEKGLQSAQEDLPFLKILPIEILEKDQHFFSFDENAYFLDHDNISESDAINWYKKMLTSNGFSINNLSFGKNKAALTIAFEWGCPNQTLAALWYSPCEKNRNWSRLFNRRE